MDWGLAGAVTFTGLVVVFSILLLLVLFCYIISLIFKGINNRPKKEEKPETKKEAPKAPPAAPVQKAVLAPAAQTGVTSEVVAAISAAIACILGPGKQFALRSVKRVGSGRNAWNAAGIAENTRPF